MRGLSAGGEQPYFRIMNGPREGERIEIADAQEYIIGRDETADIIFKDDLVSRRHVKVRRDWSGVHVEDRGSRNGRVVRNPARRCRAWAGRGEGFGSHTRGRYRRDRGRSRGRHTARGE